MERYGDVYGREIRYGELPPDLNPGERRSVSGTVAKLNILGDALARFEDVWNRLHRANQKLMLLRKQREEHGGTHRIKRSIKTAEQQMKALSTEYAAVDRALTAALKGMTGAGLD